MPQLNRLIHFNLLVLDLIKVKKADRHEVLSRKKITEIIDKCEKEEDIYGKAVILLADLVRKHPFASGNRRTAFIAAKDLIIRNHLKFGIEDDPLQARVMIGIRENYYTDQELKEWLKHGKIREFRR